VTELLDGIGARYVLDHRLVRGLDYYTRTTFEFFVAGREGQQQALGGGGRYDGLVEHLGGRPTPGIGFGIGIDRTVLAAEEQAVAASPRAPLVAVISPHPDDHAARLQVASLLRDSGLSVRTDGSARKLGRQLETAAKVGARWAVIVQGAATVPVVLRDLQSGEQQELPLAQVPAAIGA
jgi:histidyl-tRNA synthetase